ncbi:exported hypothetical protein [Thiocapsa sp. KS1]|nr:hypothetical protein [Thiocapsa sp. KS1]CRI67794.1 exported hypothetical protein [Thiocapsa sp. KS1]
MDLRALLMMGLMATATVAAQGQAATEQLSKQLFELKVERAGDRVMLVDLHTLDRSYGYFTEPDEELNGRYYGVLLTENAQPLAYFRIPRMVAILCRDHVEDGKLSGGCEYQGTDGEYSINAPYFAEARFLDIFDETGVQLGRLDIAGFRSGD